MNWPFRKKGGPRQVKALESLNAACLTLVRTALMHGATRLRQDLEGITGPGIEKPQDWVIEARLKSEKAFMVWSIEHDAWWAPNHSGYVQDPKEAGRYSFDEAIDIVQGANAHPRTQGIPNEAIVLASTYES